jgi:hypothetical protein
MQSQAATHESQRKALHCLTRRRRMHGAAPGTLQSADSAEPKSPGDTRGSGVKRQGAGQGLGPRK